ncbi:MAG: hypothetical protein U0992_25055 [Planctomycetaceae bacterium]
MELLDDGTGRYLDAQGRAFDWDVRDGLFITTPRPRETGLHYWKVRFRQWYYMAIGDGASGQVRSRFTQSSPDSFLLDFQPQGDQLDVEDYKIVRVRDQEENVLPSP